mgnify:CR=1 FL=1
MLTPQDAIRVRDDAMIACDALQSLISAAPYIHESYVKEKLRTVKNCIRFIEQFEEAEDETDSEV